MRRERLLLGAFFLLAMSFGCATRAGEQRTGPRGACLKATVMALKLERAHIEKQLRQAGTGERRNKLEQRAGEVRRDLQRYSAMRPEHYRLPKPITLIGRIKGDNIYFLRQSRSGPFYHPVGTGPVRAPDVRYRFRVYPLYRRWYWFPSWYVWIGHAEKAEVVSLADYFDIKELTRVNVGRPPRETASAPGRRRSSSSDPQVLKKLVGFLEVLPYAERPARLRIPENAPRWRVELVRGRTVAGRLDIRGTRLCAPRTTTDFLDKETELVKFIQGIANEAPEKEKEPPWGDAVRGIAVRAVPDKRTFGLGKTPVVVLELKRATRDGQVPDRVSLKNVSVRAAIGGSMLRDTERPTQVRPVEVGKTFARMRVRLSGFGFFVHPWINADCVVRIGYRVGFNGGKAVFAESRPLVLRIDTDMKALDAHVRDLMKQGSKACLAQVARIPREALKEDPEDYLRPMTLHQPVPMPYRQDAGYYYGRRLALRHLGKGVRKKYPPARSKDTPFIQGFLLGYEETWAAALRRTDGIQTEKERTESPNDPGAGDRK